MRHNFVPERPRPVLTKILAVIFSKLNVDQTGPYENAAPRHFSLPLLTREKCEASKLENDPRSGTKSVGNIYFTRIATGRLIISV